MSNFHDNIGGCEFDYYIGCDLCKRECPNRKKEYVGLDELPSLEEFLAENPDPIA